MKINNKITSKNKSYLVYLIGFFIILALPVLNALPFFDLPAWLSPPDWGKVIVFRVILSIILFLFIRQLLSEKNGIILKLKSISLYFWLLLALFTTFLLSAIFSQDSLYSFFGDPHRAGGFLTFGSYIIFSLLAFLILQKKDWQKMWDFSIFIGILVSIFAVFQQYNILGKTFIAEGRPGSTIGNSVLLSAYLLLLVFITLSYFLKEEIWKKRIFYLFSFLLFLFVILLTQSRGTFLGLLIGFVYFIFAWPKSSFSAKWKKIIIALRILAVIIFLTIAGGVYYINTHPKLPQVLENNNMALGAWSRFSIKLALADPRFANWLISLEAIKEKPILGWGPENFSIAFDKHYDPSLPYIDKSWGSWYDKAHNFLLDIGVTAGIPAVIIYISVLGALFYGLQKIKKKQPENYLFCHGMQAAFLGYFVNNLFVFDSFSSYLILFLLIAFSLYLISSSTTENFSANQRDFSGETIANQIIKYKTQIIIALFVSLVLFIWTYNIKPLQINAEINSAPKLGSCQKVLPAMEKIMESRSFLDHYLGIKYANTVNECLKTTPTSESVKMVKKAVTVLEKNTEIRPTYTRNWLTLGIYANFLLQNSKDQKERDELKNKADYYFQKAGQLSLKRQEIFVERIKTYYLIKDYKQAAEIAQQCIDLSPTMEECWWLKGLSNIYLNNTEETKKDFAQAQYYRYNIDSFSSLSQLIKVYLETKKYEELIEIHQKLIASDPKNIQYYAALAYNYKVIGNYKMARETAQKILEINNSAETKKLVDEFLQTLR